MVALSSVPLPTVLLVAGALAGALGASALSRVAWNRRERAGATPLAVQTAINAVWLFTYGVTQLVAAATRDPALARVPFVLSLIALSLTSPVWVVFALEYAGEDQWIERRYLAALLVVPAGVTVLLATNWLHHVQFSNPEVLSHGGVVYLAIQFEPGYWVMTAYSYLIISVGFALLGRLLFQSVHLYRRQVALIVASGAFPVVGNVLYLSGAGPIPRLDLSPFTFLMGAGMVAWALFGYRFLDLSPVARTTIVEDLEDGLIVVDDQDRIVDVNETAGHLAAVDGPIGRRLAVAFPDVARSDEGRTDGGPGGETRAGDPAADHPAGRPGVVTYVDDGDPVYYGVRETPLLDHRGERSGRAILLSDVTEQVRYERALERRERELRQKNDRLDEFASVVSHDLRNPITVAQGYLEVARDGDDDAFDEVEAAIDRMEQLTDDLLSLARQGESVTDPSPTGIAGVAREAWSNVETGDATLAVADDRRIQADRSRLLQLFENLFRNAIEHADPATVRVGGLDDDPGFYVADDGPGIPPARRDEVFDRGYTTDDGTGFGLAIVEEIATAHGWTVSVTEGTDGGARFEVGDVEVA